MRKPVHIATTVTEEKEKVERMVNNAKHLYPSSPDFLDRKIEFVTADLHDQHGLSNHLHKKEKNSWGKIYLAQLRNVYNVLKVERQYWPFDSKVKMIPENELTGIETSEIVAV